jgi:hypothetical protein
MANHEASNIKVGSQISIAIKTATETLGFQIGFWQIPRKHNKAANQLAKAAATNGDVASAPKSSEKIV